LIPILLSTASCFPETLGDAFEIAKDLKYDGIELMVSAERSTQSLNSLLALIDHHQVPITSVHAPCLLISQRVWGLDPWVKVVKSVELAQRVGSQVVVLHPPFIWQRKYATNFADRIRELEDATGIMIAIENMFPWQVAGARTVGYAPSYSVLGQGYRHVTLDLSHTGSSGENPFEMLERENVVHLHLADSRGSHRDEHLVPGEGFQPCDQVLQRISAGSSVKSVALEVMTRHVPNGDARRAALRRSLEFARQYLQ